MRRIQPDNPNNAGSVTEIEPKQDEEPKSSETHQLLYTRRFPRIGSQFQTRITKDEPSCRPLPDKFSLDYPHLSMKEVDMVQEYNALCKGDVVPNPPEGSLPQHGNGFAFRGGGGLHMQTPRGGLLIHSPFNHMEKFPTFVRPLLLSQQGEPQSDIVNETWKQQMIQLHSCDTGGGKRSRASRGGVKRKRANTEEELVWSLERLLEGQNGTSTGKGKGGEHNLFGEEDAFVFEQLKQQHNGNVKVAELNLLVQLSGGKASKMRRCGEMHLSKQKSKSFSPHTSASWREMYERMKLPSTLGQLQNDSVLPYNFNSRSSNKFDGVSDVNLALTDDDLKDAWRSILACGKSMEGQLSIEGEIEKKPLLSTLLTFIGNSCGLPAPESCFGTHHVMVDEVSNTMGTILVYVERAQQLLAKLRDFIFDGSGEGIDSDNLLKFLDTECKSLPIRLTEVDDIYSCRTVVVEWESRVVALLDPKEEEAPCVKQSNLLRTAERLQSESKSHGYISKTSVQLDNRIMKAYELRDRILKWQNVCIEGRKATLRQLSSLMKEVNRVRLIFPEASAVIEMHYTAESWIDRANIAIRSKMALDEIRELILRAETIPLDFSEYLEKLKTRERCGEEWLQLLAEIVPSSYPSCGHLDLMESFRISLKSGNYSKLHELASDGSRIPVDVVTVKLLQVALDAKNWTSKAQKWIPSHSESKKGKLIDLREHIEKAAILREKLPLPEEERSTWRLESEKELSEIIEAANLWSEKYKSFLEGDNRKNEERGCTSIEQLRNIVEEANAIYVNIGNASSKMCRILGQAETWSLEYAHVLTRCNLLPASLDCPKDQSHFFLDIVDLTKAVEAAKSDVALDLEEATKLGELLRKVSEWRERVMLIAPKRSKRNGRAARSKFTVDDLVGLIDEAPLLPIKSIEEVNRLQVQLSAVEIWRAQAIQLLEMIAVGFDQLHSYIDEEYGSPSTFSIDRLMNGDDPDGERNNTKSPDNNLDDTADADGSSNHTKHAGADDFFTSGSEDDVISTGRGSNSNLDVLRLIRELQENAHDVIVTTDEGVLGDLLDSVANWCIRSFKYLNSPRQVFDKRFVGAFDRFLSDGISLRDKSTSSVIIAGSPKLMEKLGKAWGTVVIELLERLEMMKIVSEQHFEWCENAAHILADEKKLTIEKLNDLAESSRNFPASSDMVSKIRGLSVKVAKWVEKARKLFISGDKLSMQEGKALLDAGEKLRVNTQELRTLKSELRAAQGWSNRVKKCNLDYGSVHVTDVKQLIAEHDSLLIEFPQEVEELKLATVGYCICRRPYEGFMIGCDSCEEWYHGPCIGISESRADKFENFTCIRCSTKKVFESSASVAVALVRKWTSNKDLKKARQVEYQKLQRKFRKERKDVEKMATAVKEAERKLSGNEHSHYKVHATFRADTSDSASIGPLLSNTGGIHTKVEPEPGILADRSTVETSVTDFVLTTKNQADSPPQKDDNESASNVKTPPGFVHSECNNPNLVDSIEGDIASNLKRAKTALKQAKERVDLVSIQSKERKVLESREDELRSSLRRWFLRVRSLVLLPSQESLAEAARPKFGKMVSPPMADVMKDARRLGIYDLPDVHTMINCFKCLSWSLSTLAIICRKPTVSEISSLVALVSGFKLPDEKALKTLKFMLSRATQVQAKIQKAMMSKAGETKLANAPFLMELDGSSDELPLEIPERLILKAAIDDHGKNSSKGLPLKLQGHSCCNDISPHAPDHAKMWPPFGILGSQAALEVLGKECSAIPDEICKVEILDHKIKQQHRADPMITPSLEATSPGPNESPCVVVAASLPRMPNKIAIAKSAKKITSGAERLALFDDPIIISAVGNKGNADFPAQNESPSVVLSASQRSSPNQIAVSKFSNNITSTAEHLGVVDNSTTTNAAVSMGRADNPNQKDSLNDVISSETRSPSAIPAATSTKRNACGAEQIKRIDDSVSMDALESRKSAGGGALPPSEDTDPSPTIEMSSMKTPPETIVAPLVTSSMASERSSTGIPSLSADLEEASPGSQDPDFIHGIGAPPVTSSMAGETSSTGIPSLSADLEEASSDSQDADFIHSIGETLPCDTEEGILYHQQADFPNLTHVTNGIAVEDGNA